MSTTKGKMMTRPQSIADLAAAPYNPRQIGDDAASGLRVSMGHFGDLSGIVYNESSGNLVCGHQRVKQLRALGGELQGDAVVTPDGKRFPVRVVDWSLAEEMAANLEANNPHVAGEFSDGLPAVLGELEGLAGPEFMQELRLNKLEPSEMAIPEEKELSVDEDEELKNECPQCGYKF